MPEQIDQEVLFDIYCETCKHADKNENEAPCDECLERPTNSFTPKPYNYEENNRGVNSKGVNGKNEESE